MLNYRFIFHFISCNLLYLLFTAVMAAAEPDKEHSNPYYPSVRIRRLSITNKICSFKRLTVARRKKGAVMLWPCIRIASVFCGCAHVSQAIRVLCCAVLCCAVSSLFPRIIAVNLKGGIPECHILIFIFPAFVTTTVYCANNSIKKLRHPPAGS